MAHQKNVRKNSSVLATLSNLDNLRNGFPQGTLTIIAGKTCAEITAFGVAIALNAAIQKSKSNTVVFYSLGLSKERLAKIMIRAQENVPMVQSRENLENLALYNAPIFVDDTPDISIKNIKAALIKLKRKEKPVFVIIDRLQLMADENRNRRVKDFSQITSSLKSIAQKLDVAIIVLCKLELSRHPRNKGKQPAFSDLNKIGPIEQDADTVLFLHRESNHLPGIVEVIVAKQNKGQTGSVKLSFSPECARFENVAEN